MSAEFEVVAALLASATALLRVSVDAMDTIRRRLASGDAAAVDDAHRLTVVLDTLAGQIEDAVRAPDGFGGPVTDVSPDAPPVRTLSWIGIGASGEGDLSERAEEILREEWR